MSTLIGRLRAALEESGGGLTDATGAPFLHSMEWTPTGSALSVRGRGRTDVSLTGRGIPERFVVDAYALPGDVTLEALQQVIALMRVEHPALWPTRLIGLPGRWVDVLVPTRQVQPSPRVACLPLATQTETLLLIRPDLDALSVVDVYGTVSESGLSGLPGLVSRPDVAPIVGSLAEAVESLHAAGFAHGALNAPDVFFMRQGDVWTPVLRDPGLGRRLGDAGWLTPSVLQWCAPEVLGNQPYDGRRADVFSLAALSVAYATDWSPFETPQPGESLAAIAAERREQASDFDGRFRVNLARMATGRGPPSPGLLRVLTQALSADPDRRPAGPREFAAQWRRAQAARPPSDPPVNPPHRTTTVVPHGGDSAIWQEATEAVDAEGNTGRQAPPLASPPPEALVPSSQGSSVPDGFVAPDDDVPPVVKPSDGAGSEETPDNRTEIELEPGPRGRRITSPGAVPSSSGPARRRSTTSAAPRNLSTPPSYLKPRSTVSAGWIITLMIGLIVAGVGWVWWSARQAPAPLVERIPALNGVSAAAGNPVAAPTPVEEPVAAPTLGQPITATPAITTETPVRGPGSAENAP